MIEIRPRNFWAIPVATLLIASAVAQSGKNRFDAISSALQSHEYRRALDLLSTALREAPGNAQLWAMQGVAYSRLGQKIDARASLRQALKISPDYVPALQEAAQLEFDAGDAAAIPLLERLLRLRPSDPTTHAMLAVLEYRRGECEPAIAHFEKVGPLFDKEIGALHAYAACLVRLRRLDKAATVFERSLALDPDNRQERQLLASIQVVNHQPQNAIATLTPSLENAPDAATLELASAAFEDAGYTDRAVEALRQAILLDPMNVHLYLDFAAISAAHQSFQVGINVVNDGIGLQPKA